MPDAREPDPRFPDRPTHEDFVTLSDVVQLMDHRAEILKVPIPEIIGVDMESFMYFLENRMGTLEIRSGRREFTQNPLFKATYMDAFTLGKLYAEAKARTAGPPYTVEGCEHCAGCGENAWECVCEETSGE